MENLLQETINSLNKNGKETTDVLWVGSRDGNLAIQWNEFVNIANVNYDNGFGGAEIIEDLVVVGNDFWLERHEYNGSEWWEFKTVSKLAQMVHSFNKIVKTDYEESLAELNGTKP